MVRTEVRLYPFTTVMMEMKVLLPRTTGEEEERSSKVQVREGVGMPNISQITVTRSVWLTITKLGVTKTSGGSSIKEKSRRKIKGEGGLA